MPYIDFKLVKKLCTIEQLLAHYVVKLRVLGGDKLKGKCPLPAHGTTQSESFSVSRGKNLWNCFDKNCNRGGNVLDFVMQMESCTLYEAAAKLMEWFGPAVDSRVTTSENGKSKKSSTEKAAPHMETRPDAPDGNIPGSHSNGNSPAGNGKSGYMKQIDEWFDQTIRRGDQENSDDEYYHRIRNAIKSKLIESFKSGKAAAQSVAPARP